ncbi:hypothetical protein [Alishewanella agri]|uniref:hypothetical protein n=1 Tax=Alishewanella agri TaxID=553384 RepID=UPI0012E99728|nr:hypothetical protein [Alishewanella agri]
MRKHNLLLLIAGLAIPVLLLLLKVDMSSYTLFLWPTWIFLLVLGGQFNGVGDYVFVGVSILLNGGVYLVFGNMLRLLYVRLFKTKSV